MVRRMIPLAVVLAAVTLGCQARTDDGAAANGGADVEAAFAEVDVPTEEEAAEEAAATITAENEDDEFAKLKAEIEGDTSDL